MKIEHVEQGGPVRRVAGGDRLPNLRIADRTLAKIDLAHQLRRFVEQVHHLAFFGIEKAGVGIHRDIGELGALGGEIIIAMGFGRTVRQGRRRRLRLGLRRRAGGGRDHQSGQERFTHYSISPKTFRRRS